MPRHLAIDLGTANTLVHVRGLGVRVDQPTVIAVDRDSGEILAMGDQAHAMIGRTPGHLIAVRPLRGGAVSDFDTVASLFRLLLRAAGVRRAGRRPLLLVSVPCAVTQVERRAVRDAAVEAGAREAHLIEQPMAAAIGAGLPVAGPTGHLVVDVGGGTTQAASIALGGIVAARAARVGGFDLDAAVQHHVRRHHGVAIGERTAERVRIEAGPAAAGPGTGGVELRGREVATGMPRTLRLGAGELRAALEEPVSQIVAVVVDALAATPPELLTDLLDTGILLTGGASRTHGLGERIAAAANLPVRRADVPLRTVVTGAGRVLDEFGDLVGRHLA